MNPIVDPAIAARKPAVRLLLALGRGLHEAGFPAPLLESMLERVSERLGLAAQFFSTPTSLFVSVAEPGDDERTHLLRVEPASVDLGKLAALDGLIGDVLADRCPADDAVSRLEAIRTAPPRYGRALSTCCWALSSAAFAVFLGGGLREIAVGGAIGFATGLLALAAAARPAVDRLFEPLAAIVAAFFAVTAAHQFPPLSVYIATLAGLVSLLPGFTLTIALSELATRHLSSGTARFAYAAEKFLMLGLGVALGSHLAEAAWGAVGAATPVAASRWLEPAAIVAAPLALTVLLRAPLAEAPWIVVTGFLALQGGRIGAELLSPELGMFGGALVVGIAGALYARLRDRPIQIVAVPGLFMLVPGSVGYKSVTALLAREVVPGVETAFRMILVAASLVAGILVGNLLLPVKRRSATP